MDHSESPTRLQAVTTLYLQPIHQDVYTQTISPRGNDVILAGEEFRGWRLNSAVSLLPCAMKQLGGVYQDLSHLGKQIWVFPATALIVAHLKAMTTERGLAIEEEYLEELRAHDRARLAALPADRAHTVWQAARRFPRYFQQAMELSAQLMPPSMTQAEAPAIVNRAAAWIEHHLDHGRFPGRVEFFLTAEQPQEVPAQTPAPAAPKALPVKKACKPAPEPKPALNAMALALQGLGSLSLPD